MTIARLAPAYQGRILLPVLGKVTSKGYTDRVAVRLVSGQSAADFAARADNLAHGFGAVLCRVRSARAGALAGPRCSVRGEAPRPHPHGRAPVRGDHGR